MRRLLALVGALLGAVVAAVALASPAAAEAIVKFHVDVTVNADTSMHIVETIAYDFGFSDRHGIFRDIPIYDETLLGQRRWYDVTVASVTRDGKPEPHEDSEEGQFRHVKIGDPNVTMEGAHTYVIDYTVRGGLRSVTSEDVASPDMPRGVSAGDVEMYWDVIGLGWEVPIRDAVSTVSGPATPLAAACWWGASGAQNACPVEVAGVTVTAGGINLGSGEGMTVDIIYPRSAFTTAPVENTSQGLPSEPAVWFVGGAPIALIAFLFPAIGALLLRRHDKGVHMDASPAQYAPPDGLSAAEMAAAWKGPKWQTESRVLVATLVDLAARGWITLSTEGDFTITRQPTGTGDLRPWESTFLDEYFHGESAVVLRKYDQAHTATWTKTYKHLVSEAKKQGIRNPKGDQPDKRWNWLHWTAWICWIAGIAAMFLHAGQLAFALIPIGLGAFLGWLTARLITPRKETQKSAEFGAKVRGLEKVLHTDPSAARRELAQSLGLPAAAVLATMLPYAIVFKLEKSWMGAFPDLTPADLAMTSLGVTSMPYLSHMVSQTSSSVASASYAPSSGFSGGGGSGGGGGGGGGGSW